jgi:hypothetical protein
MRIGARRGLMALLPEGVLANAGTSQRVTNGCTASLHPSLVPSGRKSKTRRSGLKSFLQRVVLSARQSPLVSHPAGHKLQQLTRASVVWPSGSITYLSYLPGALLLMAESAAREAIREGVHIGLASVPRKE